MFGENQKMMVMGQTNSTISAEQTIESEVESSPDAFTSGEKRIGLVSRKIIKKPKPFQLEPILDKPKSIKLSIGPERKNSSSNPKQLKQTLPSPRSVALKTGQSNFQFPSINATPSTLTQQVSINNPKKFTMKKKSIQATTNE